MSTDDPEDCPTFTRRPPAAGDGDAPPPTSRPMVTAWSGPPSPRPPAIDGATAVRSPAEDDDDDGPPTDVDDGPPTFSLGAPRMPTGVGEVPGPSVPPPGMGDPSLEHVTLVNAAPPHQRLVARVVTADATHLFVAVDGEPAARRISRVACFEHPVGGGWSTWRLSGADRERWHVPGPLPSRRRSKGDDASA